MTDKEFKEILESLQTLAEHNGFTVTYDDLCKGVINTPGGSFVLKGKNHILIHRKLKIDEKVDTLTYLLAGYNIDELEFPKKVQQAVSDARNALLNEKSA